MAEETLNEVTGELAALTLHDVLGTEAALTEDNKVPDDIISGFRSDNMEIRRAAVIKIRKILQNFSPSCVVQPVINTGLVPALVCLLDSDDIFLQCEGAWIVTNIASGTTQQTEKVIEAGAISKLVKLTTSPNEDVADNAVWALANIVGDSWLLRDRVEDEGGVNALVTVLNQPDSTPVKVMRRAVWAISCYLNPWSPHKLPVTRLKNLLPCLVRYVQETPLDEANMEAIEYAVQSLERICDRRLELWDFIETGIVPRLVRLVADSSSSSTLQSKALKCLGFLVCGNDEQTDVAVNAGLLPALLVPLESENRNVCQLACWTASNVAAGNRHQAHAVLDSGILKQAIRILMDVVDSTICRREACWIISNLARKIPGDSRVGQAFIEQRCVQALSAALLIPDRQTKELAVVGITRILEWNPPQELEADGTPLAILRNASGPQNLRAARDSRGLQDRSLKRDCHNLLTRYFPEYTRRARV